MKSVTYLGTRSVMVSKDYLKLDPPEVKNRQQRSRKYFYPDLRKSSFRASYYQPNEVETRPVHCSE